MIFMPLSQLVAIWLIREAHSMYYRAVTALAGHPLNDIDSPVEFQWDIAT